VSEPIVFATSNEFKFNHAVHMIEPYGIELIRKHVDLEEIQADGETICRRKADQAFAELQHPVIVNDDSWSIPGLKGFPGAYMKYMNEWLTSEDWLRLTSTLKDRRIFLEQHIVYQDAEGQHYFYEPIEAQLLTEIRGSHKYGHIAIASFDGIHSVAELHNAGKPAHSLDKASAWKPFAEWYLSR
jgi:non-canonical purine NTP pyrophosphatase (RdgB/HAM1 family)